MAWTLTLGLLAAMVGTGVGCGTTDHTGPEAPKDVDDRRAAFPINDEDFSKIGYRRDWLGFPTVAARGRIVHVLASKDLVMVQDSGSTATALEASNGERRWANELASPLSRFVGFARTDARVLACGESEIMGLRPDTGDIVFRQRYSRVVNTKPVLLGNLAIFGTASGEVMAHGMGLGFQEWAFGTGAAISRDPVQVGNNIGVVNDRGEVFFFEPATGAIAGRSRAMYNGSAFNPIAAGEFMVVASQDQSIYAFRPGSERPVWQYRSSAKPGSQPVYFNGKVLCEVEGSIKAFDAKNGAFRWKADGITGEVVAVRKGNLVVQSGTSIIILDAERGDVIERISVPGIYKIFTETPGTLTDGNLYIASTSGLIAKFQPR